MSELINVELEQDTELESSYELSGGIVPTGEINITTNGQHNVSQYATANVNVQGGITPTGTKQISIDSAGTITEDVTNYASAEITTPQGEYNPSLSKTVTPTISVSANGLITASVASQFVADIEKESFVEGYVTEEDVSATARVSGSATQQLSTQGATTITPSTSQQTAVSSGKYTTGNVLVAPIPSQYIVPSGTKQITDNGTGIDVSQYASVDVNVSGGGGDAQEYLDNIITATTTTNFVNTTATGNNLVLDLPFQNIKITGAFTGTGNNRSIGSATTGVVDLPNLTAIGISAWCNNPVNASCIYVPRATTIGSNFMTGTSKPNLVKLVIGTNPFNNTNQSLRGTPNLKALVIKCSSVPSLASTNPVTNSGIGQNSDAYIYVPSALLSSFQTATNWSTFSSKFRAIESYPLIDAPDTYVYS